MEWTNLISHLHVPASSEAIWTRACDFVEGPALLRVNAEGTWYYAASSPCGPDGDTSSLLSRSKMLFHTGPVGALIGKIGGSSAGTEDGKIFLAGSFCIFALDKDTAGPLFFTINDEFGGMANNREFVSVSVDITPHA